MFSLMKTHFLGKRIRCANCDSQFEFTHVNFIIRFFTRSLDVFVGIIPIALALLTGKYYLILFALAGLIALYALEVYFTPLQAVGLRKRILDKLNET